VQSSNPQILKSSNLVKIPAAWLIEQCGWKGKTLGGAQVWSKQPLVIVNVNNATPEDIIALAAQVSASVKEKFGINIHPEVNYI
jgi:UDP-N-acetylmuramate dehydrogenase